MAAQKLFVEVQDEQGNIYYVHTSSDVVFCADGETVEEKLKNATTEKDGRMSAEDKKKLDGIAVGANKYVHPTGSGNKHIPSGGSAGQVLRWSEDGTAEWGADKDTTYAAFKAATASAAGGAGLVPAPAAGNHDDYLRGDGKWGAASDMVQAFSQASSRANITSGEANKTLFGKIAKWFADLGVSGIAAFAKVVNNGTTTVANTVLDGRFGKTLLDRIIAAEKNITTINSSLAIKTYSVSKLGITSSTYLNQIIEGGMLPPGSLIEFWVNDTTTYGKELQTALKQFNTTFYGFCFIYRSIDGTTRLIKCIVYNDFKTYVNIYTEVNSYGWMDNWIKL